MLDRTTHAAGLLLLLCITAPAVLAADGETAMLDLSPNARGDYAITVSIKGQPVRLLVDPDTGSHRLVNPDVAARLGFKPSMVGGRTVIGTTILTAKSDEVPVDYGPTAGKRRLSKDRFLWMDRTITDRADGFVSPVSLPYGVVRYALGAPQAGERTITLPLEGKGFWGVGGGYGTVMLGDQTLRIGFNLNRRESLITASAAVMISATNGGRLSENRPGTAKLAMVRYGVERPVRPMTLASPLNVGGLAITDMLVRVSDVGDASAIPDASAPVDRDEIVVTGKTDKKLRHTLTLGRDALTRCSSLVFDQPKGEVRLSCL